MRFSKTTGCFYPKSINYPALPDDLIDVTDADYKLAASRKAGYTLDVVNGLLVVIPKPEAMLDDLKVAKIEEIGSAFISATKSGYITTYGIKMNSDITDVQRLKSAYDLAVLLDNQELPVVVDYDNNVHANLSLADVLSLIKELGRYYESLYIKKQTLRGQAMSATNQSQLDLIIW